MRKDTSAQPPHDLGGHALVNGHLEPMAIVHPNRTWPSCHSADEHRCLLTLDLENALNQIDRSSFMRGVRRVALGLAKYSDLCCTYNSFVLVGPEKIPAHEESNEETVLCPCSVHSASAEACRRDVRRRKPVARTTAFSCPDQRQSPADGKFIFALLRTQRLPVARWPLTMAPSKASHKGQEVLPRLSWTTEASICTCRKAIIIQPRPCLLFPSLKGSGWLDHPSRQMPSDLCFRKLQRKLDRSALGGARSANRARLCASQMQTSLRKLSWRNSK